MADNDYSVDNNKFGNILILLFLQNRLPSSLACYLTDNDETSAVGNNSVFIECMRSVSWLLSSPIV